MNSARLLLYSFLVGCFFTVSISLSHAEFVEPLSLFVHNFTRKGDIFIPEGFSQKGEVSHGNLPYSGQVGDLRVLIFVNSDSATARVIRIPSEYRSTLVNWMRSAYGSVVENTNSFEQWLVRDGPRISLLTVFRTTGDVFFFDMVSSNDEAYINKVMRNALRLSDSCLREVDLGSKGHRQSTNERAVGTRQSTNELPQPSGAEDGSDGGSD